ncbi:ATP-binding cassette domain-containing protein, partial [Actinotalea sp.]|uniref:ATP-binding cassette domain-containing protein n=1 Tax=Actinotalea sp. TaxID=1872145 RepID=UPI00356399B8
MTDPTPLLSIRDLSVAFRSRAGEVAAVNEVTLDVLAGQTVAVVGESGSGKSTTAAAVNRLLPGTGRITSGQVLFDGRDLASLSEREMIAVRGADIGFVPQDPMSNLNPLMRVGEQIAEALEVHGKTSGAATQTAVIELLDMVGIGDPEQRMHQYPHEFSGGMRQRVLIAMGLACRPRLLIADEPTSALDVTVQRKILDELDALVGRLGTAVILITHDLGLAAERADTIVVMNKGRVVESGTAQGILDSPQDEYTRRLLAAAPSLTSTRWSRPARVTASERAAEPAAGAQTRSQDAPLVRVERLSKTYLLRAPRTGAVRELAAVSDVGFTIPRGRTVSLVGESGSGKSTTANIVLGLETATEGQVFFDGVDIAPLSRRELFAFRRRIQPVFQNPYASLDPRYTVEKSIAEPMRVHRGGTPKTRRTWVATLLDQVALPSALASRLPHELSGGQRQRVAIARALALSPELVVLD